MFKREAGWIMRYSQGKYVSHYYPESQTKALCGKSDVTGKVGGGKKWACQRCLKALEGK